jgi:hypothetical protein
MLRTLEQNLDSAIRLECAIAIEEGCAAAWNIVLPLLQV